MVNWHEWDSHKQRIFTGIALIVPLLTILTLGPLWSWCALVILASGVGMREFEELLNEQGLSRLWEGLYFLVGLILPLGAYLGGSTALHAVLVTGLFCGFLLLLATSPLDSMGPQKVAKLVLGWLYVPYLLSYVLLIGRMADSRSWMLFILITICASDAGAFYAGRRWGRHKLYEAVSPGKTMEGALGGLIAGMALGTVYGYFFLEEAMPSTLFLLSGALALVGQIGDLVESMMKRVSGKKDSSQLLPGHGGLLDRLDSLLFAFPAAWLFLVWSQ